ncbi:hypothetical protein [Agrobacterium vitis]|uniref:hypothetical protein n=1 Tax=Agrobacterium vitis TaxID=373 RepID=UPI0012E6F96C|nr:hypothetical protein [Agrobacterium vitis]MVA37109.1 hypothetical protein [Agrobacterium vitis]
MEGTLPGSSFEIKLDRRHEIQGGQAKRRDAFTLDAIATLLPETVPEHQPHSSHAKHWTVEFDDRDGLALEGYDDNHQEFKAELAADGTLLEIIFTDENVK